MSEHLFIAVEKKVDNLLQQLQEMRNENLRLKENDKKLKAERHQLMEANRAAYAKIDAMITRLKSMEQK